MASSRVEGGGPWFVGEGSLLLVDGLATLGAAMAIITAEGPATLIMLSSC